MGVNRINTGPDDALPPSPVDAAVLPYYDRKVGAPIAAEAAKLHQEAWRRIEQLPEGELRANLSRAMYK